MALQKVVGIQPAEAVVGMLAAVGEANHFSALTYEAGSSLTIGNFVWRTNISGEESRQVVSVKAGSLPLAGILIWTRTYAVAGFAPTMQVQKGEPVQILVQGKVWVQTKNNASAPKVGDNVFAVDADGTVKTAAGDTLGSATKTNFVVEYVGQKASSGENDYLILISNQQVM